MSRYRAKPVEVEAVQWSGSNWHEMLAWIGWGGLAEVWTDAGSLLFEQNEVIQEAPPGSWVLKDVNDVLWVRTNEDFLSIYEPCS